MEYTLIQFISNFFKTYKAPITLIFFYALASKAAQTLQITAVTSFVLMAGKKGIELATVVNEISTQYTLIAYALASLLIAATVYLADKSLYINSVFWTSSKKKFWQLEKSSKEELYRGATSGLMAGIILLIILYVANQINFLGLFITSALGTPVFPLFIFDAASLLILIFAEEFIFRHKILNQLLSLLPEKHAIVYASFAYLLIKYIQFEIGLIDSINLLLLNVTIGFYYLKTKKSHRGIGLLLILYGFMHSITGLPLWGHMSPSVFLLKPTTKASILLSGGELGPMASLGMLSILFLLCVTSFFSWRREN